jgi:hypothetical protein
MRGATPPLPLRLHGVVLKQRDTSPLPYAPCITLNDTEQAGTSHHCLTRAHVSVSMPPSIPPNSGHLQLLPTGTCVNLHVTSHSCTANCLYTRRRPNPEAAENHMQSAKYLHAHSFKYMPELWHSCNVKALTYEQVQYLHEGWVLYVSQYEWLRVGRPGFDFSLHHHVQTGLESNNLPI